MFKRHIPDAAIEVLSFSVLVSTDAISPAPQRSRAPAAPQQPIGKRAVFDGRARARYRGPGLSSRANGAGRVSSGPAIIAEDETSTYVSASFDAHIDGAGCIVMERKDA